MVGIIGAMDVEVNEIVGSMNVAQKKLISGIDFYSGLLKGRECVAAKCGPGKVNAAICAQAMLMEYNPEIIINIGVAGGLAHTKVGDLVVATACVQHDFDTSALDGPEYENVIAVVEKKEIECDRAAVEIIYKKAREIYDGVYKGIIATGDVFVAGNEKCQAIHNKFSALAVEMEGGAIAQAAYLNKTPFVVIRTISDNANDHAIVDFPKFAEESAKKVQALLKEVIVSL